MSRKKTTEGFIKECVAKFGDKFDYSLTRYTGDGNKIAYTCPEHGVQHQLPNGHLRSIHGCKSCSHKVTAKRKTKSLETFIDEAIDLHGDDYTFEKTVYVNAKTKLIVTCVEHGDFKVTPNNFISHATRCPKCAREDRSVEREEDDYYYC